MKDHSKSTIKVQSKRFRLYYIIILILLIGIAFVPVRECIRLICNVADGYFFEFANENLIIPFTAITFTLLVGFSLLPVLIRFPFKKAKITVFMLSVVIFVSGSLFVEKMALKQWDILNEYIESSGNDPNAWEDARGIEAVLLIDGEYLKARTVGMNRSGVVFTLQDGRGVFPGTFLRMLREDDASVVQAPYIVRDKDGVTPAYLIHSNARTILPVVKIHYYVFSIVLILVVLNLLYNLSELFTSNREQVNTSFLIIQGLAAACYLIAFLFVKVIKYEHFLTNRITIESAISALFCIIMAAVSGGLFAGNLLNFSGKKRFVPSIISSIIVIVLYIAEYFMLGGAFYRYGGDFLYLASANVSVINIVIVLLPALIVFYILKLAYKMAGKTRGSLRCLKRKIY